MCKQRGVTLIELLVTIALVSIVVGIGVPSFRQFVLNNRLLTTHNQLVADLNLARSESVKRAQSATVCPRNTNDTACATNWNAGWMVFVDANRDGTVNAGQDTVLILRDPLRNNLQLQKNGSANRVTFDARGFSEGFASTFALCDDRGTAATVGPGRSIVLNFAGRIRSDLATTCMP